MPRTGAGRSPTEAGEAPSHHIWTLLLVTATILLAVIVLQRIVEDRRVEGRRGITGTILPARASAQALQTTLAREIAALRGFLLTGDQAFMVRYGEAAAVERRRLDELERLAAQLGGEWPDRVEELVRESMAWHARLEESGFLKQSDPSDAGRRVVVDPFAHFQLNMLAMEFLDDLVRLEEAHWADLAASDRLETGLTAALVLLALATAFLIGWASRNAHRLAAYHVWRARQEQEFRRLAQELAAASDPDDLAERLVVGLCELTESTIAFVERVLPGRDQVVVGAAVGAAEAYLGETAPYQGSLTQRLHDRDGHVHVDAIERLGSPIAERLAPACRGCSALAVPLVADGQGLGAVVLVQGAGRPRFTPRDIARIKIVGQFASLAIIRVMALKEAERRGALEAAYAAVAERRRELTEQAMKGRAGFIRGFSHDLKNPLGAIIGYAGLLESGVQGELSADQKKSVHRIGQAAHAALRLISDIVDLSRAEAGELRIELRPTSLAEGIHEVVAEYHAQAETAGLELEVSIPPDLPEVCADSDRVRQILGNLLSNAVKYTEDGRIGVVAAERSAKIGQRTGHWVVVDVTDTGPGIPVEDHEQIFKEFSRLGSTGEKAGTGLGLAISRKVARIMKGDITVDSEPGRGSTFTLWLRPVDGEECS